MSVGSKCWKCGHNKADHKDNGECKYYELLADSADRDLIAEEGWCCECKKFVPCVPLKDAVLKKDLEEYSYSLNKLLVKIIKFTQKKKPLWMSDFLEVYLKFCELEQLRTGKLKKIPDFEKLLGGRK